MKNKMIWMKILPYVLIAVVKIEARNVGGITEPIQQAVISATVAGRISEINRDEGSFAKKGEIILSLEKEKEELLVQIRKLTFESKSEVNAAREKKVILSKDYTATTHLFENSNSISEEQLWEKELNYKQACAEVEKLEMKETEEEIEFKLAQVALNQLIIRAPFDCFITKRYKNLSESCNAQEPLVRVVNVNRCRFVAYIDISLTHTIKKGNEVELLLSGASEPRKRTGIIEFISPEIDPSSSLRTIKVIFDNQDKSIEPGVSGELILE